MNIGGRDASGDDNLESLATLARHDRRDRLGGRHGLMGLVVVSDPDGFVIGDAEVDTGDHSRPASPEFAQPLVRDVEVSCHRHGEDAAGTLTTGSPHSPDAVTSNERDPRFRCQVDEYRHGRRPVRRRIAADRPALRGAMITKGPPL